MRGFLKEYPKFQKVPFYIFCESYGGKMAAEFALQLDKVRQPCEGKTKIQITVGTRNKRLFLYQEQKAGKIKVNFKGVGLGDAWISPIDSVLGWAPYLLQTVGLSVIFLCIIIMTMHESPKLQKSMYGGR